jgi:hypothetical protein
MTLGCVQSADNIDVLLHQPYTCPGNVMRICAVVWLWRMQLSWNVAQKVTLDNLLPRRLVDLPCQRQLYSHIACQQTLQDVSHT